MKPILLIAIICGTLGAGMARAGSVTDYGKLNLDNIPPLQVTIQNVLQASASGQFDLKTETVRSRISNLAPTFRVQWGETTRNHNLYGVRELETHRRYYDYPGPTPLTARDYDSISRSYGVTGVEEKAYASWHVLMRWKLNNLLINRDEIYLREMRARTLNYQKNTIDNAVQVYTTLAKLLIEKAELDEEDPYLERDITLAAAELDFLSGNLLSKTLQASGDTPQATPETVASPVAGPVQQPEAAVVPNVPSEESAPDPQLDPSSPLYELGDDSLMDLQEDNFESEFEDDLDQ